MADHNTKVHMYVCQNCGARSEVIAEGAEVADLSAQLAAMTTRAEIAERKARQAERKLDAFLLVERLREQEADHA